MLQELEVWHARKTSRDMLVTLDECIDYMQTHPRHKEAETYRSRYRLLLTRALTLVRNAFMSSVRETTTEVAGRIAAKQLNDTTQSALLYAKFRVNAAEMKELGLEIQKRAMPSADAAPGEEGEYQSLMNELHASFATCRARLILPLVQKRLADIAQAPSSRDLVQFARESITYVRGICLDEFELWREWFHGQRGLYDVLESLCEPLYDHLRPRIVHESRLSKLCSLVTLLQTRYMHDEEDDSPQDLNQLDFSLLVQPALEDTQTRLLFRAQAILRDDIENYKPTPSDLDWPRSTSSTTISRPYVWPSQIQRPDDAQNTHSRRRRRLRPRIFLVPGLTQPHPPAKLLSYTLRRNSSSLPHLPPHQLFCLRRPRSRHRPLYDPLPAYRLLTHHHQIISR